MFNQLIIYIISILSVAPEELDKSSTICDQTLLVHTLLSESHAPSIGVDAKILTISAPVYLPSFCSAGLLLGQHLLIKRVSPPG